jgi:peptidoglycan hydrolase-like protein with peptidoglycan-binding domain
MVLAIVLELSWQSKERAERMTNSGLAPAAVVTPSPTDSGPLETPAPYGSAGTEPSSAEMVLAEPRATVPAASNLQDSAYTAAASSTAPAAVLQEIDSDWLSQQQRQAWTGLARLWQAEDSANAIQAACDGQERTGFACLRDQGSWSRVKKLGLPVILVLQDNGPREVLLQGMGDGYLLLGGGDQPVRVNRDDVDAMWLGDYIVAWPQAPDWPLQISRGEAGTAVDIAMQMAKQAQPAWTGGGVFDANFELWLMTFQRRNGLEPDGIIGPKTLLYLMAPTIVEPRLLTLAEENS